MTTSKNVDTHKLLIKYKKAGIPDHIIAARMNISVNEVRRQWEGLQMLAKEVDCGYGDLTLQFNILCHQYQLLGESLKILADAITNRATPEEVEKAVKSSDPVKNLFTSFIILRPFVPVDPAQALEEATKKIQEGN